MKVKELRSFTDKLKAVYETGVVKTPIHLSCGNEKQLTKIFKDYKPGDWIFSTYRSHYHWLLSGRSAGELMRKIKEGHSMHLFDNKFFTSAIVSGQIPIALGVALALKLKKSKSKVFCFMGDMASMTGIAQECFRYAKGHDLPIKFIIEDNGLSVTTPTADCWGKGRRNKVKRYRYKREYPHAGTGKYVLF